MDERTCSIEGCDKPADTRGWCGAHYCRWKRTGDPGADIPVRQKPVPGARCAVDGCDKAPDSRGWCAAHYERWRRTGDPAGVKLPAPRARTYALDAQCAVEGCGNLLDNGTSRGSRGWCGKHYHRWHRYGDPLFVTVIVGNGQARLESYIDRSGGPDACHLWTGRKVADGYGQLQMDGKGKSAHVAAWELENGPRPAGAELDHECHNRAVRDGSCRPGICPHRLCCNLRHIILRSSRAEHLDATVPWDRTAWARSNAKLTAAQVREIRSLLPVSRRADLAERYDISTMAIYRIATGRTWGWLPAS
jgi:HNH endonuclease